MIKLTSPAVIQDIICLLYTSIMLSIKSALADADQIPTLIFDEIDTGISGQTARAAGVKMKAISKNHQVICVTHSAQIASLADQHFYVSKTQDIRCV